MKNYKFDTECGCKFDEDCEYCCDYEKCKYKHNIPPIENKSQIALQREFYKKAIESIKTAQDLNTKTKAIYDDLLKYGLQSGAYYGEPNIIIEEGFNTDNMSPYKIIKIRNKSVPDGKPIFVKLHTAYNNTTNSGLKENALDASEVELAQVLIPAINANNWYGYVTNDGAPLVTNEDVSKWTFGFTKTGKMKVYTNQFLSENVDKLKNDCIVWSMGADNVLIFNGEKTHGDMIKNITDYTESNSRVIIAQNYETKETFILTCGDGMSAENCTNILLGYGADVAIQTISGENAIALNEGGLMFTPYENKISEHIAYIYVSKKDFFKNSLQHDIAYTTQILNQTKYLNNLNTVANNELRNDLKSEVTNRKSADTNLKNSLTAKDNELQSNIEQAESELTTALNNARTALEEVDRQLQTAIDTEKNRAEEKESEIETSIDTEKNRAEEKESEIETSIENETIRATAAENGLKQLIQTETSRAKKAEEDLTNSSNLRFTTDEGNITDLQQTTTELRSLIQTLNTNFSNAKLIIDGHTTELSSLDEALTSVQTALSTAESALDNLKTLYNKLNVEQNAIDSRLESAEQTIDEIPDNYVTKTAWGQTVYEISQYEQKYINFELVGDLPAKIISFSTEDKPFTFWYIAYKKGTKGAERFDEGLVPIPIFPDNFHSADEMFKISESLTEMQVIMDSEHIGNYVISINKNEQGKDFDYEGVCIIQRIVEYKEGLS